MSRARKPRLVCPPGQLEDSHLSEGQALKRLFDLSPDMLCIAGADGYFKMLNPAFERFGYTREELMGRPFLEVIHPDDRLSTLEEIAKLSNGVPTVRFENRYVCRDGSLRWLSWTATPVDGLFYAVARDDTALKEAEAEIQRSREAEIQAARALEALTYSVSHDLRAPLRAIKTFSLAVLEDFGDRLNSEGRMYLERIRGASLRMAVLIEGTLALVRIGRKEIRRATVDLTELARRCVQECQHRDPERTVRILIAEGLRVQADASSLGLALEQLIQNAWKFTRSRVDASIEVGKSEGNSFYVRDNGVGFDMAQAGQLFKAGQRLDREDEFEGLGMGLAIAQRVVQKHGGRLWAEAQPSEGATFYCHLPE